MKTIITLALALALIVPLSLMADPDSWGGPGSCGATPMMMGAGGPGGQGGPGCQGMQCDMRGHGGMAMGMHGKSMRGMGQGMGQGMGMGMGNRTPGIAAILRNADDIGLSDDQVAQLRKLRDDFQLERVDKRAAMEKARIQLHSLMTDDKATQSTVFAQIDEVNRQQAEMEKMWYTHAKSVKGVLTDDQWTKLKDLRQDRMKSMIENRQQSRMQQRMDRRGSGRGMNSSH